MENAKLVARFKKNFLDVLHWGPAIGTLDGTRRLTIPWWRDAEVELEPGKHHITIAINYLLVIRGICKAELDFEVAAGDTLRLEYRLPTTMFQRGRIDMM